MGPTPADSTRLSPAQIKSLFHAAPWSPAQENYNPSRTGWVVHTSTVAVGRALERAGLAVGTGGDRQYTLTDAGEAARAQIRASGMSVAIARRVPSPRAVKAPSWREIAKILAARVENYAHCAVHDLAHADPASCPFCDDRAAYQMYQRKAGKS